MFPLSRNFLKFAAAGAFLALTVSGTPARADEMAQNLGPVGPHEPMITTVGSKRVIAFYVPGNGGCNVQAVIWNSADVNEDTTSRVRTNLNAGQSVIIDTPDNKTLKLQCGSKGDALPSSKI